jgi:hypothetical protein
MASFQLPAETESTKDRQRRAQAARRRQKA